MATPTPWGPSPHRLGAPSETGSRPYSNRDSRDPNVMRRDSRETSSQRDRPERVTLGFRPQHSRNGSGNTGVAPSEYTDNPHRRHDYDLQAMETDLSARPGAAKNPIPAPTVTIRSEFPTMNRSRQQQPLTCLITVEVPEGNWRPDANDLRHVSLDPPHPQDDALSAHRSPVAAETRSIPISYEPREALDEIAEELRVRVDNWHGLEFNRYVVKSVRGGIATSDQLTASKCRFGKLRLYGQMRVGKDRDSWQELECYLFDEMLICVKEKKNAEQQQQQQHHYEDQSSKRKPRCTLKGSILIKKHLKSIEATSGEWQAGQAQPDPAKAAPQY